MKDKYARRDEMLAAAARSAQRDPAETERAARQEFIQAFGHDYEEQAGGPPADDVQPPADDVKEHDGEHCYHPGSNSDDEYNPDDDDCVHCDCCCTCLACEYGPRDGMLMFPAGVDL